MKHHADLEPASVLLAATLAFVALWALWYSATGCYKGDPGHGDVNYPTARARDAGTD